MKGLFFGILTVVVIGILGLFYRNAIEHPYKQIACPMDAKLCPDGTAVGRTGTSCTFEQCPPPNVSIDNIKIAFAVPPGFVMTALPDSASVAAYNTQTSSSTESNSIIIRRYTITASSTALSTIQQTAIGGASGAPVSATSFSSSDLNGHRFTIVQIERFEGVIDTAYYLARNDDVLRFDAIDRGADWTNPNLDVSALPAHSALLNLLNTLQGQ